jgi:hypothetical protein
VGTASRQRTVVRPGDAKPLVHASMADVNRPCHPVLRVRHATNLVGHDTTRCLKFWRGLVHTVSVTLSEAGGRRQRTLAPSFRNPASGDFHG